MEESVVTYGDIEITPYVLVSVQSIKIVKRVNEHVKLTFTGIIPEEKKDSYVNATGSENQVSMIIKDGSGKKRVLFEGIVLNVSVRVRAEVYYLHVEAISNSYALDIKRKERSFQNPQLSYTALINDITSSYQKAHFKDDVTNGKKLGKLVMQYEETDWQFLKRIASHFYTVLIPDASVGNPRFYFGLPENQEKGEIKVTQYTLKKRISDYRNDSENHLPGAVDADYNVYEIECNRLLELGNSVKFKAKRLIVGEAVIEMKEGILNYRYKLFPRNGLRQNQKHNNAIIGASIQGRVLRVKKNMVQAKLDMDDQEDQKMDYWFPYSTIYASENNTGWYFMPEENDSIRIYFPSNKEEEGIAISSVVKPPATPSAPKVSASSSSSITTASNSSPPASSVGEPAPDRMGDPAIKTLRTKYGKEIMLAPDKIIISAGDMQIILSDADGIQIISGQNVDITATQNILLSSQNIGISASKLTLSGNGNEITLEDNVTVKGSEIKMN
ncbi:MAG TPA: phage baseplate assembly protein V [Paenibacillus sp.]